MASAQLGGRPVVRRRPGRPRWAAAVAPRATAVPTSAAGGRSARSAVGGRVAARACASAPARIRRDGLRPGARLLAPGGPGAVRRGRPDGAPPPAPRYDVPRTDRGEPTPPLRLTLRGRRLLAGLAVAAGIGVALATTAVVGGGSGGLEPAAGSSVVVRSGDTLWSIAGDVAPDEDRRAIVDAIVDINDLDGVGIVPGQVLRLP